jgi:hypothetical protein
MSGHQSRAAGDSWWNRLVQYQRNDFRKGVAFLRGKGDIATGRMSGFIMAAGNAAALVAMTAGWAGHSLAETLAREADPRLIDSAAGVLLVLGVLAYLGKAWATAVLMIGYPAAVMSVMARTAWKGPLWNAGGWHLLAGAGLMLAAALAVWVRIYYVLWRAERRTPQIGGDRSRL